MNELLFKLKDTADGVRYQACHGGDLTNAHKLQQLGLIEWKGNSFGSNFYCITEAGLKNLADTKI